jgi:hypothetical protein
MIDSSQSTIQEVSVHIVGNGGNQEGIKFSPSPMNLKDERIHRLLVEYFLSNFNSPEYHAFTFSNNDLSLNAVYKFVQQIFAEPETFHEQSISIAKHLYDVSQHPNIKAGDLYVARLSDVFIDNQLVEAVGIFKCENKETYLKLDAFDLSADEGINLHKLDKGCLILDIDSEEGYKILIVDNANKSEAQFWRSDFLNIKPLSDAFHHTHNFMNLTREYVSNQLDEEFSVSKADQIDLLNRSMDFFKSREQFNKAEFESEVLGDVDVIESFRNFGKNFQSNHELDVVDNFEISVHAVQRQARVFKSVLKLDKNFHIYIHGNRQLIEKGFDEVTGKHFYKLYFDEES